MASGLSPERVLFVAAEAAPLVKVGGLADVVGSLPTALLKRGCDVRVLLPLYGTIDRSALQLTAETSITVRFAGQDAALTVFRSALPRSDVPLYLIDCPEWFGSDGVYPTGQSPDKLRLGIQRFVAFSTFAAAVIQRLEWQPDVIHCHDWHTALLPMLLDIAQHPTSTVLSIHNLHNQGVWSPAEAFSWLGLEGHERPALSLRDQRGDFNIFKVGLNTATVLSTVSPTYAEEIRRPEFGEGLDDDLRRHRPSLVGITNGLDTEAFNPAHDQHLAATYDAHSVTQHKTTNKEALQRELGLEPILTAPLFVAVSRLSPQKGFDLLPPVVDDIVHAGGQVAILGSGWPEIEGQLHRLAGDHPRAVVVRLGFDAALAQRFYAGGDFFLMPSRFEPCGLGQMIAMRYGTVPIVRDTGGLRDTVADLRLHPDRGTGIVFSRFAVDDFRTALHDAVQLYRQPGTLQAVQRRAMEQDFSWTHAADDYLRLYAQAKNTDRSPA